MRNRWLAWPLTLTLLGVTACQGVSLGPVAMDSAAVRQVVVSPHAGGTISLRILPPAGFQTQAAAKNFGNVSSLTVKLVRKSDNVVVADSGAIVPSTVVSTVSFTNVTTGTVYQLEVDAFEGGTSIAKGGPQRSSDINVTSTATHNVSMNLHLKDATGGSVPFQITPPAYLSGTITFQTWLRNQATDAVVAMPTVDVPAGATTAKTLRDLDDGTYSVWGAARDATASTPAMACGTVTIAGGVTTAILDTTGSPVGALATSFVSALSTAGTVPGTDLRGMALDANGVPYVASNGLHAVYRFPGSGPEAYIGSGAVGSGVSGVPRDGAVLVNPMGCAINANGDVFVAEGNGDRLRIVPKAGAATYGFPGAFTPDWIYTLKSGDDEITALVQAVAVAPTGELYYHDNRHIRRQSPAGGAFTALGQLPLTGPGPKGMTTDKFGNLFAVAGTKVHMYVVRTANYFGQSYTASTWQEIATLSGDLRGVAIDPIGNAYVTNDGGLVRMIDATDKSKVYTVAGGGASAVAAGLAPTGVSVPSVYGVGVTLAGRLYFTASSSVWQL